MSGIQTILFATTAVWAGVATLDAIRIRLVAASREASDAVTIEELRAALSLKIGKHLKTIDSLNANIKFAEDHWKSEYRKLELEHEALEGTNQRLLAGLTHAQMEQGAARKGEEIALYNEAKAKLELQEALAKAPKPVKAAKEARKKS